MALIAKTEIATSDPLSICEGFALFPALGTFRSGYVGSGVAGTIFDVNAETILLFRLTASADYKVVAGLCGPAYAAKMDLQGSTSGNTVSLTVSENELQAGVLFGLTLTVGLNILLDSLQVNWVWDGWHSHFQSTWAALASWEMNLEIDVIEWIYEAIQEAFSEGEDKKTVISQVPTISNALIGSWGMYDERSDTFAVNNGQMVCTPTLNLPIDISGMIEPLVVFNAALKVFFSKFSLGPLIGIQIPVTVSMNRIKLDNTSYTLSYGNGAMTGTTTGTPPANPTTLTAELDHTAGFDLGIGLFANLNLVKLFNIGFSITWPLLALLGIEPSAGPYANTLTNTIGSTTIAQADNVSGAQFAGVYDVVFEDPGSVAA